MRGRVIIGRWAGNGQVVFERLMYARMHLVFLFPLLFLDSWRSANETTSMSDFHASLSVIPIKKALRIAQLGLTCIHSSNNAP